MPALATMDDMSLDIDSRIQYVKGNPGDARGELRCEMNKNNARFVKVAKWGTTKDEMTAIREMKNFVEQYS